MFRSRFVRVLQLAIVLQMLLQPIALALPPELLQAKEEDVVSSGPEIPPFDLPTSVVADTATPTPSPTESESPTAATTATETATETASASATETATATATESATATQESTPTQTATATETATESPTEVPVGETSLGVEARISPTRLVAGQTATVTVTLSNKGTSEVTGLSFSNTLPTGLTFLNEEPKAADAVSVSHDAGLLTASIGSLAAGESISFHYKVQAAEPSNGEVEILTDVLEISANDLSEIISRELELTVIASGLNWGQAKKDAKSSAESGGIRVDMPAGALGDEDTLVAIHPGRGNAGENVLAQFELVALKDKGRQIYNGPDSRRELEPDHSRFSEEVTLTFDFNGLYDLSSLPSGMEVFVAVWSEQSQGWVKQPIDSIDEIANTLTVKTWHFSTWGAGIGGSFPDNGASIPLFGNPQVALFTGKAGFSLPLWVPAGRQGMQPDLNLSYSSSSVDGVLGDIQAPWVGMGWNIDSVEISRLITSDGNGYGYENEFILSLNGAAYPLVADPLNPGRYYTENRAFLYVQRHNPQLGNEKDGIDDPINDTKEWWEVVTADGTRYRLGWDIKSEQLTRMTNYSWPGQRNPIREAGGGNRSYEGGGVGAPTIIDAGDGSQQMIFVGSEAGGATRFGAMRGYNFANWSPLIPVDQNIIEAESGIILSPMEAKDDYTAASQCGVVWDVGGGSNGSVELGFELDATATTYIWLRVHDTYKVKYKIDGGTEYTQTTGVNQKGRWVLLDDFPSGQILTSGAHEITFTINNTGARLDAIAVSQDSSYVPMDGAYCDSAPIMETGSGWYSDEIGDPEILYINGQYEMWFSGFDGTNEEIGRATSSDGVHWTIDTTNSPVLTLGSGGAWDDVHVSQPTVIHDGTDYQMWYAGYDGSEWAIGHATSSDGISWTKDSGNPVLTKSGSGWYSDGVMHPDVINDGTDILMFFVGMQDNGNDNIGLAKDVDGSWVVQGKLSDSSWVGKGSLYAPTAAYDGTNYHLFYQKGADGSSDIYYATTTNNEPTELADWEDVSDGSNAWYNLGYAGEDTDRVASRWRVDLVEDVYGNTISYEYIETDREQNTIHYDRASYLSKIRYTGKDGNECSRSTDTCYEVRFELKLREDDGEDFDKPAGTNSTMKTWDTWDDHRLKFVEVYVLGPTTNDDILLRSYELKVADRDISDADNSPANPEWDAMVLTEVITTAYDIDESSLTLPKMSFSYTDLANRANNGNKEEWAYPRLTGVDNGTDGSVAITYANDGRDNNQHYSWMVSAKEVDDGVDDYPGVTSETLRTEYTYAEVCYQKPNRNKLGYCNNSNSGNLVGYGKVTVTQKGYDMTIGGRATIGDSISYFYTDQNRAGKTYRVERRDASGVVHFRTDTDYDTFDYRDDASYPLGTRFGFVDEVRQYEREGTALKLLTVTRTEYDTTWGELTSQKLYYSTNGAFNATTGLADEAYLQLYTQTDYTYLENLSGGNFLHSFPRSQILKTGSGTILSAVYSAYDDTTASLGTDGELSLQQSLNLLDGQTTIETVDVSFNYDSYGNVTEQRAHGGYGTLSTIPTDSSSTDRWSTVTYDTTFNMYPVTTANLLGHTTTTTYDFEMLDNGEFLEPPLGLPREVQDPNGAVSEVGYDLAGRAIKIWQPGQATATPNIETIYPTVDATSKQIAAPYSIEMKFYDSTKSGEDKYHSAYAYYDGMGRILTTVGPAEDTDHFIISETLYGPQGVEKASTPREITITAAQSTWDYTNSTGVLFFDWSATNGLYSMVEKDAFGRATKSSSPKPDSSTDRIEVETAYDGRITTSYDALDRKTVATTNPIGQLISVDEYSGTSTYTLEISTSYEYDTRGLLIKVIDELDNETVIQYNAIGQKVALHDPDMGNWTYSYDIWGQMVKQIDGRADQTEFSYDQMGRPTLREVCDSNCSQSTNFVSVASYSYDDIAGGNEGLGRLTSMTSYFPDGATLAIDTMTYNELGQVMSATRKVDIDGDTTFSAAETFTASTTYDSLGRTLTATLPIGEIITSTYNARGLLESVSGNATTWNSISWGADSYISDIDYTATGAPSQQSLGNGVETTYTYNDIGQMLTLVVSEIPSVPLLDLTYTYDGAGNIDTVVDDINDETIDYDYDFLDRLTDADYQTTSTSTPIEAYDYYYDKMGNITGVSVDIGGTVTETGYEYPTPGETSTRPHAASNLTDDIDGSGLPIGTDTDTFTYDANGNMTQRVVGSVTWDYTFDAENRLVEVDDGTTITTYTYDGNGARVLREVDDGTDTTTTVYTAGMEITEVNGGETERKIFYPGGAMRTIDSTDDILYFSHGDHLGSTSLMTDSAGDEVTDSKTQYTPFGEVRNSTTLIDLTDFGFTGQILDRSSGGLMYYNARYYLPSLRRFISADTVVPDPGNSQAWNRYSYVINNPVNLIDPSGNSYCDDMPWEDGCDSEPDPDPDPPAYCEIVGGECGNGNDTGDGDRGCIMETEDLAGDPNCTGGGTPRADGDYDPPDEDVDDVLDGEDDGDDDEPEEGTSLFYDYLDYFSKSPEYEQFITDWVWLWLDDYRESNDGIEYNPMTDLFAVEFDSETGQFWKSPYVFGSPYLEYDENGDVILPTSQLDAYKHIQWGAGEYFGDHGTPMTDGWVEWILLPNPKY